MVVEYIIACPECGTEIQIVTKRKKTMVIHCLGCEHQIVAHKGFLIAVTKDYFDEIAQINDYKVCGKVLSAKLSAKGAKNYQYKKFDELSEILSETMDVSDFLEKIQ